MIEWQSEKQRASATPTLGSHQASPPNGPVATRQTTYVDDVAAADSGTFLEAVGAACIALESFPLAYARPSYAVVPSV